MSSSDPASPPLFPQLMAVMDVLDRTPEEAEPNQVRSHLSQAAAALCQDQGVNRSQAAIDAAVNQVLNPAGGPAEAKTTVALGSYDFKWKRPTSPAEWDRARQHMDAPWRRLLRWGCPGRRVLKNSPWSGIPIGLALIGGGSAWFLDVIRWMSGAPFYWSSFGLPSAVGAACLAYFIYLVSDWSRINDLGQLEKVAAEDLAAWRGVPSLREYVSHAIAATGCLLIGDLEPIKALQQSHDEACRVQEEKRRQEELSRW